MEVQSFLLEENQGMLVDSKEIEAWTKQITKLKLDGQAKLISDDGSSPVMFKLLSAQEHSVYKNASPTHALIENYEGMPIPLKALSLVALAEKEGYFHHIEIWHNDIDPDPLIVGMAESYGGKAYLIAIFGTKIKTFEELAEKAKLRLEATREAVIAKNLVLLNAAAKTIKEDVAAILTGENRLVYIEPIN